MSLESSILCIAARRKKDRLLRLVSSSTSADRLRREISSGSALCSRYIPTPIPTMRRVARWRPWRRP